MLPVIILISLSSVLAIESKSTGLHQITYFIPEEVPKGTRIGKLLDDIYMILGTYSRTSRNVPLSLMAMNWQDAGYRHFAIDQTNGYLVVKAKPDRETLCPESGRHPPSRLPYITGPEMERQGTLPMPEKIHTPEANDNPCTLALGVVFSPEPDNENPRDPILFTVNVVLTDINDHTPIFPQTRVNYQVGESTSIAGEMTINLPMAVDPDAGSNGTLTYWLEYGDPIHGRRPMNGTTFPFRLEGLVDGNPLRLRLIQPLDYETTKEYDVWLYVEDNGKPASLNSRLRVHIDVVDENDNGPVFSQPNYFVIINESSPRGTILLDIHAHDADSGQNGQVSFELEIPINEESKQMQQLFDVRTTASGNAKLSLRQSPDLEIGMERSPGGDEQQDLYLRRSRDFNLRVIASDNGSPRRHTAEAAVTVRILDVNDMAPKISVNYIATHAPQLSTGQFFGGSGMQRVYGELAENVGRSLIAFVTVLDLDSGPWGQVTCRTDNDAFELIPNFSVGGGAGFLESSSDIDEPRLANKEISFKLMARKPFDREAVKQVTFRVVCIDNQFKSGQAQTFVQNLSPPALAMESANPGESKQLTIVTDKAEQLSGTALVNVRIIDENDCPPEFSKQLYTFSVDENVPNLYKQVKGTSDDKPIGILQASDKDMAANLTYKLISNPLDAFQLNPVTGVLYLIRPLDREAFLSSAFDGIDVNRTHGTNDASVVAHLSASVSDGKFSAETQIHVTIADVNDCPPVFEKTNYEFVVEENQRPASGVPIGAVLAHDSDAGQNGKILYRLQPTTDINKAKNHTYRHSAYNSIGSFKIDASTGKIYALRSLDREQYSEHKFYVVAVDVPSTPAYMRTPNEMQNQFSATATVTVIVSDENDNAPSITYPTSHTTLIINSGTPAGHQIFTTSATDPDLAENGTIRFTLRQSTPGIIDRGRGAEEENQKNSLFSIDDQTGIVLLTDKLPLTSTKYLLTVGAHDLGSSVQKNTSVTVIIQVVPKAIGPEEDYRQDSNLLVSGRFDPDKRSLDGGSGRSYLSGQPPMHAQQRFADGGPRDDEFPDDSPRPPLSILTDRVIIFVLSSIFVVLLIVTVVLIFLIRRRRYGEISTTNTRKDGVKGLGPEDCRLKCAGNTLQLMRHGSSNRGKAVLYRAGASSEAMIHSDSETRSGLTSEKYPQTVLGSVEDPYTSLKPIGRNHVFGDVEYKTYNHCIQIPTFPSLFPVQEGPQNKDGMQSHTAILYSPTENYATGFSHVYPVCATASTASRPETPGQGIVSSAGGKLFPGLTNQPLRSLPNNMGGATYADMPQGIGEDNNCGYQMLLEQKVPLLLQRPPSGDQPMKTIQGQQLYNSPLINNDPWPTTSQDENTNASIKKKKIVLKTVTLQPICRSNSSHWQFEEGDLTPLQRHKLVTFSSSNISLNNLAGEESIQTAETSFV